MKSVCFVIEKHFILYVFSSCSIIIKTEGLLKMIANVFKSMKLYKLNAKSKRIWTHVKVIFKAKIFWSRERIF